MLSDERLDTIWQSALAAQEAPATFWAASKAACLKELERDFGQGQSDRTGKLALN